LVPEVGRAIRRQTVAMVANQCAADVGTIRPNKCECGNATASFTGVVRSHAGSAANEPKSLPVNNRRLEKVVFCKQLYRESEYQQFYDELLSFPQLFGFTFGL